MPDPRFSGVEAVFALDFMMSRANRKLVASGTEFRMNHKMRGFSGAVFHVLHGVRRKRPLNSEKSVRRRTFWIAKMLMHNTIFIMRKRKAPRCAKFSYRIGSVVLCSQHAEEQFAHAALTVPLALLRADIPEFPISAGIQWRRIFIFFVRIGGVAQIDAGGDSNHDPKLRAFRRDHESHNMLIQLPAAQIVLNRLVRFHRCHDVIPLAVEIQTVTRIYILLATLNFVTGKDPFFDV